MDPLDISDLLPSQGFMPSSSDDEDDISPRNNKHLGSRLASIFGVPTPPKEQQEPPKKPATSGPIFSCSCELQTPHEGGFKSEGPVGVSVISSNDATKYCLLVYGTQKEPKALFFLAPGETTLEFAEDYLQLTKQNQSIRLKFEPTARDSLGTVVGLYNLLCIPQKPQSIIPSGDSGKTCEAGSTILYETQTVEITETGIEISEMVSNKAKLINKANHETQIFLGLHRGDFLIQSISVNKVRISQLKKMKSPTTKPTSSKENTPSLGLDTTELTDKVVEHSMPRETPIPDTKEEETKNSLPIPELLQLDAQPTHLTTVFNEYEAFHRIVGVEMDRLQIRLQDSFAKSLEAALAPIKDEIRSIRLQQDDMLKKISKHANGDP